jgi:hypothetical protein
LISEIINQSAIKSSDIDQSDVIITDAVHAGLLLDAKLVGIFLSRYLAVSACLAIDSPLLV